MTEAINANLNKKRFSIILLFLSILFHLYAAIVMEGRFWYDSLAYFEIANALISPWKLNNLFSGDFGTLYNHIGFGLPFLIAVMDVVFGEHAFIAIVVFQVFFNAWALFWLVQSLHVILTWVGQVILTVLLSLHPYFAAFHNAVLTESFSASLCMIAIGAFIRCTTKEMSSQKSITIILTTIFICAQFRYYLAFPLSAMVIFLILFFHGRSRFISIIISSSVIILSLSLSWIIKYSTNIENKSANIDAISLVHSTYVAWDLSEKQIKYIDSIIVDTQLREKVIGAARLNYLDALKIFNDLRALGLEDSEIRRKISHAALHLRVDTSDVIMRQLRSNLTSLGFQRLAIARDHAANARGFKDAREELSHYQYYYEWMGGISPIDYKTIFLIYLNLYSEQKNLYSEDGIKFYNERVGPYVTGKFKNLRDPIFLGKIPPDLVAALGILSIFYVFFLNWRLASILFVFVMVVYLATLIATVVGSNRYSYVLLPIYFCGIVISASHMFKMLYGVSRSKLLIFKSRWKR